MPFPNAVIDVPEGMFPMLATFNFFVAFGLLAVGGLLAFFNNRGLGFKGRKVKHFEESKDLSVAINFVTGFIYLVKAIDFIAGPDAMSFSLNAIAYLDYTLTCPMLVYDLGATIGLAHSAFYGVATFIVLLTAVMATIAEAPRCYAYFSVGSILFVFVGALIFRGIRDDVWPKTAPQARASLRSGLIIFFSVWPCFPILWLLSAKGFNVLPSYIILLLHGVLDLLAKSVFGVFVLRYRLFMEDAALAKHDADLMEQGRSQRADDVGEAAASSFIVRWLGGDSHDQGHADPVSAGPAAQDSPAHSRDSLQQLQWPVSAKAKATDVSVAGGSASLHRRSHSGGGRSHISHHRAAAGGSTRTADLAASDSETDESESSDDASHPGSGRERVLVRLHGGAEAVVHIGPHDDPTALAAEVAREHALSARKELKLRAHLESVQRDTAAGYASQEDYPRDSNHAPAHSVASRRSHRSRRSRRSHRRTASRAGSRASRRSRSRAEPRVSPEDVHIVSVPGRA